MGTWMKQRVEDSHERPKGDEFLEPSSLKLSTLALGPEGPDPEPEPDPGRSGLLLLLRYEGGAVRGGVAWDRRR